MLRRILVTVIPLVATAFAGCLGPSGFAVDLALEVEEPDHLAMAEQQNCVAAGLYSSASDRCPRVATALSHPLTGIAILDAFFVTLAGPTDPLPEIARAVEQGGELDPGASATITNAFIRGSNPHRSSGGALPDMITPGGGVFIALLGLWDNDGDRMLEVRRQTNEGGGYNGVYAPDNEWAPLNASRIVAYLEPGSHPSFGAGGRPPSDQPDFEFMVRGDYYVPQGASTGALINSYVVFLDGSLLARYTMTTVSDPLLAPDPDGTKPYRTTAGSLVDVDVYAAIADGPVANLYAATVGATVAEHGSVSHGTCPNTCHVDPETIGRTPLADAARPFAATIWGRYPSEFEAGSGSTSSGRWQDHNDTYRGWVDVIPKSRYQPLGPWGYTHGVDGPLIGANAGGQLSAAPGLVAADVWVGVFRDLNGDGRVGFAPFPDPYEGGLNPHPDDYLASRGEYLSFAPVSPEYDGVGGAFNVTLIPDDDWGPAGAIRVDSNNLLLLGLAELPVFEGPIVIPVFPYDYTDGTTPGRFFTRMSVFLPLGSPGFTMCVEPLVVEWALAGLEERETVADCDHVARWQGFD